MLDRVMDSARGPALQPVFAMPQCSSRTDVRVSEPDHEFCPLEMFSQKLYLGRVSVVEVSWDWGIDLEDDGGRQRIVWLPIARRSPTSTTGEAYSGVLLGKLRQAVETVALDSIGVGRPARDVSAPSFGPRRVGHKRWA